MKLTCWKVLDDKEITDIHRSSLEVLERTGMIIDSPFVCQLLKEKGAQCKNGRVYFSRALVEDCLALNVPKILITDRDGRDLFLLGDGQPRFAGGHNAVFVMCSPDGQRRESYLKDVEDFARVCDVLEDIDMIGVPLNPTDVPPKTMLAHAVLAIMKQSKKPIFFSSESPQVNQCIIELAQKATGFSSFKERSSMISQLSTTSPLYWEKGAVEALVECAKVGMPLAWLPQPIAGLTSPYTLAGTLVIHNAEVLSSVVIAHLVNPGTPQIYAAAWTSYDMRFSNVIIARPEEALLRIAGAQMAHFYHMPSHTIGPDADANIDDEQLGWEKMLTALAAVCGGNDLIVNSGMFGTGMTVTCEQLLLDNEVNRFAKRMAAGFEVNADTMAVDLIDKIGPRGCFLDTDHTLTYLRTAEHLDTTIVKGMNYENWKNSGSKRCTQFASEKVHQILQTSPRHALDEKIACQLQQILTKWDTIYC